MKNVILLLALFFSFNVLANEFKGLRCESLFTIHEYSQTQQVNEVYTTNKLSLTPIFDKNDIIGVNNLMQTRYLTYTNDSADFDFELTYKLNVGQDISTFELLRQIGDNTVLSFGKLAFKTKEGFSMNVEMMDDLKIEFNSSYTDKKFLNITNVMMVCLPAYK